MKTDSWVYWCALLVAIVANITANTAFKVSMAANSGFSAKERLLGLVAQSSFWIGLIAALLLLGSYLLAIKHLPLSTAYTLVTSSAMIGLVLIDKTYFGLPIGMMKVTGIALVIVGIVLIFRNT